MSIATRTEACIKSVSVTDEAIVAHLTDGRIVSVPLEWSWRLSDATPEQRAHWELIGDGQGVRWPEVDEDLSAEGMLRGTPAKRPVRPQDKGGRRQQIVGQRLWQSVERMDYCDYFKQAALLAKEPMTFREERGGLGRR
jgi:hypothetical protein